MGLKNGGLRGSLRNIGTGVSVIPDSVVHQYNTSDFKASNWPDEVGTSDISSINGLSFDSSAFSGDGGVSADGSGDYGQSDSMGGYGSLMDDTWAMAFGFSTTQNNGRMGIFDSPGFLIGTDSLRGSGTSTLSFYLAADGSGERNTIESSRTVDDGGDYVVIIQREASGWDASDLNIYFAPDDEDSNVIDNEGYSSVSDWGYEMTYAAQNNQGSIDAYWDMDLSDIFWFDNSLNLSQRETVFDQYSWWGQ